MYILTVLLIFVGLGVVCSDLFSGTDGLKRLSVAEEIVLDDLDATRRQLEANIHQMKQIVQDIKGKWQKGKQGKVDQYDSPITLYQLIKRWSHVKQLFHLEEVTVDPTCHDNHDECVQWAANGDCHNKSDYMKIHCRKSCDVCRNTPVNPSESDCKDENEHCPRWASAGECDKNPQYMLVHCKKSCNACPGQQQECKDRSPFCESWAASKQCEENPEHMGRMCRKSCSLCERPNIFFLEVVQKIEKLTKMKPPTEEDYKGAAQGLVRLQRTYNLTTSDLLLGNITGLMSQQPLTGEDFYHIGKAAVGENEWGYGLQWLQQALTINRDSQFVMQVKMQMAKAYVKIQDTGRAAAIVNDLLKQTSLDTDNLCYDTDETCIDKVHEGECDDNHTYMIQNCGFSCRFCSAQDGHCLDHNDFCRQWTEAGECNKNPEYMKMYCLHSCKLCPDEQKSELLTLYLSLTRQQQKQQTSQTHPEPNTLRADVPDSEVLYESLCDGKSIAKYDNAVCRYRQALLPYYLFKEEILSMNPRISMVYEVINDQEADDIKSLAKDRMARGLVGFEAQTSIVRVSNVGWLADKDSKLVARITNRIELITELELSDIRVMGDTTYESSDSLQVVNYGIGGHYKPHTDYFEFETPESHNTSIAAKVKTSGDRIATFLMYLSHIEAGGATVFPEMKIRVPPIKNAAAFWFNSKLSGEYDPLTLHAGCPVLMGEKWVANKWVREYGNTFKRRCALSENAVYE